MPLSRFHPVIQRWFAETLGTPTPAQAQGWAAIREGRHTLIAAPTGSGKTLAAFLTALDDLFVEGLETPLPDEVRVVYVSPLKALSTDIHKNLAEPRHGIRKLAEETGLDAPRITAAVRTGDTTPASARRCCARRRTSSSRRRSRSTCCSPRSAAASMLRTVRTVIVDEIHAVIGTRRGAHLALSLERLQQVAERPLLRLGLSATQKPIEEVARFLVESSATGLVARRRGLPPARSSTKAIAARWISRSRLPRSPLEAVMSHEVWDEYYDRLDAAHRSSTARRWCSSTRAAWPSGSRAISASASARTRSRRITAVSRKRSASTPRRG